MDLDGAQALYQKAIELGCEEPEPYAELASIYDISKDYPKAIATYQAWLAKVPNDHEMRHQMALSLLIQGKTADGILEFETLLKAQPTNKTVLMDLGYAHLRNGQLAKAIKQFERAQPEGLAPSLDYGLVVAVVQKMSDPNQALTFVERFAKSGPAKDKLVTHLKTLQK
jgi:Flp pilus assembly protein TadD